MVEPELLDELPAEDPRAIRSRGDLRRVNAWMGNASILSNVLRNRVKPCASIHLVELGAGDGTLLLKIARRLPTWKHVRATLVDQQLLVTDETIAQFRDLGWAVENIQANVLDWLAGRDEQADVIMANLFLHHFQFAELSRLLTLAAARADLFLGCEPRRSGNVRVQQTLLALIGCNDVTRHDAGISIRAGFRGTDLSELWPRLADWQTHETRAGLFSHLFVAQRTC